MVSKQQAMNIRNATYHDAPVIKSLLEALGYKTRNSILIEQLESKFNKDENQVLVCEMRKEVVGFVAVHFIPQFAFEGCRALISYLSVDNDLKDQGIEKALEQYVAEQAKKRKCIEIIAHGKIVSQFYLQHGYQEHTSYFSKRLRDDE